MIVGSETMRHCLHRRLSNWLNKRGSWLSIVCTTKRFTGAFIISASPFPASFINLKQIKSCRNLAQPERNPERYNMKKNRHGMIRFRILHIFHKHFVWRLLNYSPEREKKIVNLTIKSVFTSTFLYNTHTHTHILYIYI